MNRRRDFRSGLVCVAILASAAALPADDNPSGKSVTRKPWGIETRVPWTTSHVVGTPDPPAPYKTEEAFPHLKFDEPLAMCAVPGANRLAIAQRHGKIYTFENDPQVRDIRLVVDVGRTVYGLAFHPQYAENGWIFVTSVLDDKNSLPSGSRISRFTVRDPKTFQADANSEKIILEWPCGGHNGGCLRFGPEGDLYLATGDGSGIADGFQTGQRLDDLLGAILRIDVNGEAGGKPYRIPADNPFLKVPNARPEIFSFGHRQVWKFSFDKKTGTMWGGEVGQDLWEMVYIIHKGGNYGWSVNEGSHPFRPERPRGPGDSFRQSSSIRTPISDLSPAATSLAARGCRNSKAPTSTATSTREKSGWCGTTGTRCSRIVSWSTRSCGSSNSVKIPMARFTSSISPAARFTGLRRPKARVNRSASFPRKLSQTGLFASTRDHIPAAGVIPYTVNSPLWSDGAEKERFLALPGLSKIEFEAVTYPQPAPGSTPGWRFPDGTVLVKTFSLEMEHGNPASRRRLETRLLHHERAPGDDNEYGAQVWYGYTYLWNDAQTDADLIEAHGVDREYTIRDAAAPGGVRKQKWHFPSRAECALCHTMAAKYALGVTTLQMNRDFDYGGGVANQLATLDHLGVFTKPLSDVSQKLDRLDDYRNEATPIDVRAGLSARQLFTLPSEMGRRERGVSTLGDVASRSDRNPERTAGARVIRTRRSAIHCCGAPGAFGDPAPHATAGPGADATRGFECRRSTRRRPGGRVDPTTQGRSSAGAIK